MKESVLAMISAFTAPKNLCLYISLLLLSIPPAEAADTQPNILFIVVDNQPASILGTYGNPDVMTPNITVHTQKSRLPDLANRKVAPGPATAAG